MTSQNPESTLDSGGLVLWNALATPGSPEDDLALIAEACRIKDRLDRLNRILTGDAHALAELDLDVEGQTVYLIVNTALGEARQQALALKTILAEVRIRQASQSSEQGVSGLAAITAQLPAGVADLDHARAARRP